MNLNIFTDFFKFINSKDFSFFEQKNHEKIDKVEILIVKYLLDKFQSLPDFGLITRNDNFYFYNGSYWQIFMNDELLAFLRDVCIKLGVSGDKARNPLFINNLRDTVYLSFVRPDIKSNDKSIAINLLNGILEINKSKYNLMNFSKDKFLTYQLPFNYTPDAECPLFMQFLNTVLPEAEKQNILCEFISSIFYKELKHEKVLLLLGDGANGKSVFFEVISALIGPNNISSYSLSSLTSNSGGNTRSQIENKLLNFTSEIDGKMNTAMFKQLASGEPVDARKLYKDVYIMTDYARLGFNCNQLPREIEHNHGFFRRFLIIPFEVTIDEDKQDRGLANRIIQNELPGVLNWLLKGLDRLAGNQGFSICEPCDAVVSQFRRNTDNVQLFIDDVGYISNNTATSLQSIYSEYDVYCSDNGYRALGKVNFKEALVKKGFKSQRQSIGNVIFASKDLVSTFMDKEEELMELPF